MSFSRFFKTALLACAFFYSNISFAQIWLENFSGANQGWTDNFTDCDGGGSAMVTGGRFEIIDMEGSPCCPAGSSTGGGNNNEWVTNEINIENACNVGISVQYGFIGTFECSAGGPFFNCTADPFTDNGHDQIVFQYSLNGGPWVQFHYVCGGQAGTATITGLSGNTIRIRIMPANKSAAETYWFDNVTVTGTPAPTVNAVADVSACATQSVVVNFSGTGGPTFNWTNNNTAIGLNASGSGNLNFPAANVSTPTTATITVTPTAAGCPGEPVSFDITVNPVPTVNQPPNISVCAGDMVDIVFTGNSPTATYNWTANIPFFSPSGTGNISGTVPPIPFPLSGTITVTPTENGCPGMPKTFTISAFPAPSAAMTLTGASTVCAGQPTTFSVNFSGNAPYMFTYAINGVNQPVVTTNNDPYNFSVTLNASATISAVSLTTGIGCTVNASGSADVTVTPTPVATLAPGGINVCQGQMIDLTVNFNGSDNYTFVYSVNNANQPAISTSGPTYSFTVEPPLGAVTYRLVSVSQNGCAGSASGTYTVNNTPAPTASISGSPTICAGQNASVTVNLSGTPPFTLIYSFNGVSQPSVMTSAATYTITGPYSATTTIEVESITSNSCPGVTNGTAIVTVLSAPTATLAAGSTTICNGQSAPLTINLAGTGPFTFVHTVNGVNQPPITNNTSPYTLNVSPTSGTTTYTLTSVASGNCIGTATGSYSVTVGSAPMANLSGNATICAGEMTPLIFNFTGPNPPFTVQYTANGLAQPPISATANPFNFSVSPTAVTNYLITAINAGVCAGTFNGSALVMVNPSATADLESGNDTICSGVNDSLLITFGGTPGPYTFIYALNGVNQDTITTPNPVYLLPLMPPTGRDTFELVSVTSPTCTGGSVSGTHIYLVKQTPHTDLSGDLSVCAGNVGNLLFNFTGTAPWTANYTADGIAQPPLVTSEDPDTIQVTPIATTTYILTDVTSDGCTSTIQDTVIMTVSNGASATIDSLTVELCAGESDTITVALGGGSPYTLTYSINGVAQAPVVTNGPTYQIISTPLGGIADTIRFLSVTSPGCLNSTIIGQHITIPKPIPTARIIGQDTTICGSGPANLILNMTGGAGPWEITYLGNGLPQPLFLATNNPDTLVVTPSITTTYSLIKVVSNGCEGSVADPFTVTVADSLTAVLSGGAQVCQNGTGADLIVTFDGTGPYTFEYTANNILQTPVTTNSNPYTFRLNPANGQVYELVSVTNNVCTGQASGTAVIFVFTPPTAEMTGTTTVCDTFVGNISVDFTGTGPFTIFYTKDGVQQGPDTTFDDPYLIPANTNVSNSYVLTGVQSPGCVGTVLGSATITVNNSPMASNLTIACDPTMTAYTVSFNTSGTAPFTLLTGSGTFTGNTFTSNPFPLAQPYNIVYKDAGNCNTATVMGIANCSCMTDAGTMSQSPEIVCVGQQVSVPSAIGPITETNDTLLYILHQFAGDPPGQIFAWSNMPTFSFQPGMSVDTTYYISAIAGNKLPSGLVDTGDVCLSIAMGTPVVFHKQPTGQLVSVDTSLCTGTQINLTLNFTGAGPFSFTLDSAGVLLPPVTNIIGNTYTYPFLPTESAVIRLDSVSDNFCTNTGTAIGSATIGVYGPATAKDLEVVCNFADATYTVKFTVASGIPPFNVSGLLTGTFMDTLFESDPIPWGTPFLGVLDDNYDCGGDTIQGIFTCACFTDAGTMTLLSPVTFCAGDSAVVSFNNDAMLDGDDILNFILHDKADTTLGTVFATGLTPKFGFNPTTMTLGQTYYISSIAGNFDGVSGVDLSDICLDIAPGTPVVWNVPPTAFITDTFDVCPGVSLLIPITLTGTPPFTLSYTNNGSPVTVTALSNNFGIFSTLQQSATYILISVQDASGCPGTVTGRAQVTVHQAPDIQNVKVTCSPDNLTYILEFDVTKVDLVPGAVDVSGNVTGTYNETTGHFTSDPIERTLGYAMSAFDILYSCGQDAISGVSGCPCPTKAGTLSQTPLTLCVGDAASIQPASGFVLEPGDTLVYWLISGNPAGNPGTWTVIARATTPTFAYNAGTMTPGTMYFIVAVAANQSPTGIGVDLTDPCLSVAAGPSVTWRVAPTASINGTTDICAGSSTTLTFTFTGTGPFNYTYTDGTTPVNATSATNTATITVTPSTTRTYMLTTVTGAGGCIGTTTGSATVTIRPIPQASITGDATLCAGSNYNFPITFTGTAPFKFVYAIGGTPQTQLTSPSNQFFISTNNIQATQTFTLISVEDAFCPGTVSGTVTVNIDQAPKAALSGNKTICVGDSAVLTLQLSGATTYNVTIGGGITPIQLTGVSNGATVTVKPITTTTYSILSMVATGNNCPPEIGNTVLVTVTSLAATAVLSNYGGSNISCPGETDGSIALTPVGGIEPFTASWSPTASGLQINDLAAGTYTVTLTDAVGCRFVDTFLLIAPEAIQMSLNTRGPKCFGETNGTISITALSGGEAPYSITINGQPALIGPLPAVYGPLAPGDYNFVVTDINGCELAKTTVVPMPPALTLDLGPDVTINLGDNVPITLLTNATVLDSISWSPKSYLSSPDSTFTWAMPPETQTYKVVIQDSLGCRAEDEITISVRTEKRVYVPNIIRPESSLFNDYLTVYGGVEVAKVRSLRIYDRWGTLIFENRNFVPGEPTLGWNGRSKGSDVNPGVFIYVAEVEFLNGSWEVFSGDVTVVR